MPDLTHIISGYAHLLCDVDLGGFVLKKIPLQEENPLSRSGMVPLLEAGDAHRIVLVPVPGLCAQAWPAAFLNIHNGTGSVFSSSINCWFPSLLIHLRCMASFPEMLASHRRAVREYAAPFNADTDALIHCLLDDNIYTYDRDLYAITEPGSFLHQCNCIIHEEDDERLMDNLLMLHQSFPYYNRPLRHLLEDDAVDSGVAEDILSSSLRWDYFPESRAALASVLMWKNIFPHRADFPFSSIGDNADSAEAFLRAGDSYAEVCPAWVFSNR